MVTGKFPFWKAFWSYRNKYMCLSSALFLVEKMGNEMTAHYSYSHFFIPLSLYWFIECQTLFKVLGIYQQVKQTKITATVFVFYKEGKDNEQTQ